MSKTAIDVAMVGIAVGPAAIAGLGFAGPFWGAAFTIGSGIATGTIALVSQRYGAEAYDQLGQAVRTSSLVVTIIVLPLVGIFWYFAWDLIALLSDDPEAIAAGAAYLAIVAFGIPFAALNLVGGRVLIGADDAWTPMVLRATGALLNIGLNAVLIFGLGMGVVGAALGTVISNAMVTMAFAVGITAGWLPFVGRFPVRVSPVGTYVDLETARDLIKISTPVMGRNLVWTAARFPMLAFVAFFGSTVVAAYVISRRIWGLMNTPGWGFGLATSSLVGQSLGAGDTVVAERYGHEIMKLSVATYAVFALIVLLNAERVVRLFVDDPTGETVAIAVPLVYAACLAVVIRGVGGTYAGALDAAGDTTWPFYGRVIGMFGFAIPLVYIGATTPLGLYGLYLAYFGQTIPPALVNAYRFRTNKWKVISEQYRPEATAAGD